jgi:hypothetical protein
MFQSFRVELIPTATGNGYRNMQIVMFEKECNCCLSIPRPGLNPRTLGPVASTLTTRPPRTTSGSSIDDISSHHKTKCSVNKKPDDPSPHGQGPQIRPN